MLIVLYLTETLVVFGESGSQANRPQHVNVHGAAQDVHTPRFVVFDQILYLQSSVKPLRSLASHFTTAFPPHPPPTPQLISHAPLGDGGSADCFMSVTKAYEPL